MIQFGSIALSSIVTKTNLVFGLVCFSAKSEEIKDLQFLPIMTLTHV